MTRLQRRQLALKHSDGLVLARLRLPEPRLELVQHLAQPLGCEHLAGKHAERGRVTLAEPSLADRMPIA